MSAPGTSPPNVWRRGGPVALVTPLCHFAFDKERRRFRLASLHPGHTLDEVRDNTGFAFDVPERVGETPLPDAATLDALRGPIAQKLGRIYPKFAADIFDVKDRRHERRVDSGSG